MNIRMLSSAVTLAALIAPSLLAQSATLLQHCDPASATLQTFSANGFCRNTIAPDASYLRLAPNTRVIAYAEPNCRGTVSAGLARDTNFCQQSFSNGSTMNDSVQSLFVYSGPSPSTLSGVYRSAGGRELDLQVSEDGRVSGYLTATWGPTNNRVRAPIQAGVARWATLGVPDPNVAPDAIQPTEDFFVSLSACAGLFVPEYRDNSACISYTGSAEIAARGQSPDVITLQSAAVRGNDQRGYDVSGTTEAFWRDTSQPRRIAYQAYVEGIGWMNEVTEGDAAGTEGRSLRMEAIRIRSTDGRRVCYEAHVQEIGWMPEVCDGAEAGIPGAGKRVEALRIRVNGARVEYQGHVQNIGWMDWVADGAESGTTGQSLRLESVRIRIR